MSKISEYSNAPLPLSGNDKLVGSSADDENSTRNFTLDELNDYFSASINPPTPYTLQDVLDNGNTATEDIVLTGNVTATRVITPNIQDINGTTGTTNQILSKGASGIVWINNTTNNLQNVLNNGNTATQNIVLTGNITSTRAIPTNIQDVVGSIGTTNQILAKGASGITWITPTVNSLQTVLDNNNTATQNIFLTGNITSTRIIPVNIQDVNASIGSTNQVLSKGASGIVWTSIPTDTLQTILNAGNSATQNIVLTGNITATRVIPTNIQDVSASIGTTGQVLSKGGSGISWLTLPTTNLQYVLSSGNSATQDINLTGDITATRIVPTNIKDVTTSVGTVGQVLSKGASGVLWIDLPTPPSPPPTPTPPAGLAGYIQYNDGTNFAGDAELFFNSTLKYLGVGTNNPQVKLHVYNSDPYIPVARFENSSTFKIDLLAVDEALQGNYSAAIGAIGNAAGVLYANIDGATEWRRMVRPYRSFVALLSWDTLNEQTILTELENDGFSISFTRTSQGVFLLEDTSGPFLANKTSLFVMQSNNSGNGGSGVVNVYFGRSGDDTLGIQVYDLDASTGSNTLEDILDNVSIEIRVYP